MSKKLWIVIASGLIVLALLLSPISPISFSQDALAPQGATRSTAEIPLSVGEILDPSGNPFAHTFSDTKDIRAATYVVAASDSEHKYMADYRCDGIADEAQIQAAIDALPAGGGRVLLLEGTFNIAASIEITSDSIGLVGLGFGQTTLTLGNAVNDSVIKIISVADSTLYHIEVGDFKIDGNKANQASGHGLSIITVTHARIHDLLIYQCKESGIYTTNSGISTGTGSFFSKCIILECDGVGFYSDNGCTEEAILDSMRIRMCGPHNVYLKDTAKVHVTNSHLGGPGLTDSVFKVDEGCHWIMISDTWIRCFDTDVHALEIAGIAGNTAYRINITGCIFHSRTGTSTKAAIKLTGYTYNIIIMNNQVEGFAYGVELADIRNWFINIIGNDFQDCLTSAFLDTGVAKKVTALFNFGASVIEEKQVIYMKNTSGGALVRGDVVSLKAVAAGNEFTTPTAVGEDQVFGMLLDNSDDNDWDYILVKGKTIDLKATNVGGGNIAIGDFLCTENGVRARKAAAGEMAFAIALEVCNAANEVIDALLIVPRKL